VENSIWIIDKKYEQKIFVKNFCGMIFKKFLKKKCFKGFGEK